MGITVRLFVDQHIYDHYGSDPMYSLGSLMNDSFEYNNVDWDSTTYDSDIPLDSRDDKYQDDGDVLSGFKDYLKNQEGIYGDEDAQHLIYDSSECGGLGVSDGTASVGIGELLNNLDNWNPVRFEEMDHGGPHTTGDQMMINMQETGHSLGLCPNSDHNCGMHYLPSDVSWYVPDESDAVYSTPLQAGRDGTDNSCGESSEDANYLTDTLGYTEYCDAYYWDNCAGQHLRDMWGTA